MSCKILKNTKAFTLIEVLVVVGIVAVCVLIGGYYGRGHIKVAMLTEARMFTEKIIGQEKVYYADKGCFYGNSELLTKSDVLFVDASGNKYFKSFKVMRPGATLGTVIVELYPDTAKYPDMANYNIRAVFLAEKDIIDYKENYG